MSFQDKSCNGNKSSYLDIEIGGFSIFLISCQYKYLEQDGNIESCDSWASGKVLGMSLKRVFHSDGIELKTLIRTKNSAPVTF